MHFRTILCTVLLGLCSTTLLGQQPGATSPPAQITKAHFGVFEYGSDGYVYFSECQILWAYESTAYGWLIKLNQDHAEIEISETLTLPEAPVIWPQESSSDVVISVDRKSLTRKVTLKTETGYAITPAWRYVEGDPAGTHEASLSINGQRVAFEKFVMGKVPFGINEPAKSRYEGGPWRIRIGQWKSGTDDHNASPAIGEPPAP